MPARTQSSSRLKLARTPEYARVFELAARLLRGEVLVFMGSGNRELVASSDAISVAANGRLLARGDAFEIAMTIAYSEITLAKRRETIPPPPAVSA
jgi:hypothetical protein